MNWDFMSRGCEKNTEMWRRVLMSCLRCGHTHSRSDHRTINMGEICPSAKSREGHPLLVNTLRNTGDINCRCKDTERNYHRQLPFWKVLGARCKLREMEQHPLRTFTATKERRLGYGTDPLGRSSIKRGVC